MAAAADPSLPNFGTARNEQLPIYHFLRAVYRTETHEAPSRIWQAAINIHQLSDDAPDKHHGKKGQTGDHRPLEQQEAQALVVRLAGAQVEGKAQCRSQNQQGGQPAKDQHGGLAHQAWAGMAKP